jgi:hypothetical protein
MAAQPEPARGWRGPAGRAGGESCDRRIRREVALDNLRIPGPLQRFVAGNGIGTLRRVSRCRFPIDRAAVDQDIVEQIESGVETDRLE